MSNNKSNFFLAGILGAAAGIIGGLLMAPQSGKETRKAISLLASELSKKIQTTVDETEDRVKDVYGKMSNEAMDKYNQVKNTVVSKVASLKTTGNEINKEKYSKVVDEVIADFKSDFESTKDGAAKLATYLKKDWEKVKKVLA